LPKAQEFHFDVQIKLGFMIAFGKYVELWTGEFFVIAIWPCHSDSSVGASE
jgi:hypothetical protein